MLGSLEVEEGIRLLGRNDLVDETIEFSARTGSYFDA
jgi:hypothetical protein